MSNGGEDQAEGEGDGEPMDEPISASSVFDETQTRSAEQARLRAQRRAAVERSEVTVPLLPVHGSQQRLTKKEKKLLARQALGDDGGGPSTSQAPVQPSAVAAAASSAASSEAAAAVGQKRPRARKPATKELKAAGPAAMVRTAVPPLAGAAVAAFPGIISYPGECKQREPFTFEQQQTMSRSGKRDRDMREVAEQAAFTGPLIEDFPPLSSLGYGKAGPVPDTYDMAEVYEASQYFTADAEARHEMERVEHLKRERQVLLNEWCDEALAGKTYPPTDCSQIPKNVLIMLGQARTAHQRYQRVVQARDLNWADLTDEQFEDIMSSTGHSGRIEKTGDFHLRALISAVTSQHIQIAVYGPRALHRVRLGIGLTEAENKVIEDRLTIRDKVQGTLLASIVKHFVRLMPYKATTWQQLTLVGTYVDARIRHEESGDPSAGRYWRLVSMRPVSWAAEGKTQTEMEEQEVLGDDPAAGEMLVPEPDLGLVTLAVLEPCRPAEDIAKGKPSSSYDYMLHLGFEHGGPVGVFRTAFVDPSNIGDVDFENPHIPDTSVLTAGTIVCAIGVQPQLEMQYRGMLTPHQVPQIVQFCALSTQDVKDLLHIRPEQFEKLTVSRQAQFLRVFHSLQLAVTNCHLHYERALNAKERVSCRILSWLMHEVEPRVQVVMPLVLPQGVNLSNHAKSMLLQNEHTRFRVDELVRVLIPTKTNTEERDSETETALLSGSNIAWDTSFVGRIITSKVSVGRLNLNNYRSVTIEFMAVDRARLTRVSKELRLNIVLEPCSRSSLSDSHFMKMSTVHYLARYAMGIHKYADLSVRASEHPVDPNLLTSVLWRPPPRTEREGLRGSLVIPPGRTEGAGALFRSMLGLQQDQNAVAPADPALDMHELAAQLKSHVQAGHLCMEMESTVPHAPPIELRPTDEQLAIATRLFGLRPNLLGIVGVEGSGKTSTLMMLARQFLLTGFEPYRLGVASTPHARRVLFVCASEASAKALTLRSERMASRQRKPPPETAEADTSDMPPEREYYQVTDRDNPIRLLRLSGRPMSEWDDKGDVTGDSISHLKLESRLEHPTLAPLTQNSPVPTLSPTIGIMQEAYGEYRRRLGVERGQPVFDLEFPLTAGDQMYLCNSYEDAYRLWQEMLQLMNEALSKPDPGGQIQLAHHVERALFFTVIHYLSWLNPNYLVCTTEDAASPFLRILAPFDMVFVDDAQMVTFPQMMNTMELIHSGSWTPRRVQMVLAGDMNGRLVESCAKGMAYAARVSTPFIEMVRGTRRGCLYKRPHSRLNFVHALTYRLRVPDEIAEWATTHAYGMSMGRAVNIGVTRPTMPDYIPKIGLSAQWQITGAPRESLELVDLQSARPDISHPLYGQLNTVQIVLLMMIYEVIRDELSYHDSSMMIVTATEDMAYFLRGYVALCDKLTTFPPVFSFKESLGHTADLVIIAATRVPDAKLLLAASRYEDAAAVAEVAAYMDWLNDARSLLNVMQQARHKVIVLTHLDSMLQLPGGMWNNLQRFCGRVDSLSTASYRTMEGRTNFKGLTDSAREVERALLEHLAFAAHGNVPQLLKELEQTQFTELRAPIHSLLRHDLVSDDKRSRNLPRSARYLEHVRREEGVFLGWCYPFASGRLHPTKVPVGPQLSASEKTTGQFVALGHPMPFYPISAPEASVFATSPPVPKIVPVTSVKAVPPAAQIAAAVTAAAAAAVSEVDMTDVEQSKADTAYKRAMARYGVPQKGAAAALLEEGELPATPSHSDQSVLSSDGSRSASTNVSSVSSARSLQTGSFISGNAGRAARQLTARTSKSQSAEASREAPAKKACLQAVGSDEALAGTQFPGVTTQASGMMMPPPSSAVASTLRGRTPAGRGARRRSVSTGRGDRGGHGRGTGEQSAQGPPPQMMGMQSTDQASGGAPPEPVPGYQAHIAAADPTGDVDPLAAAGYGFGRGSTMDPPRANLFGGRCGGGQPRRSMTVWRGGAVGGWQPRSPVLDRPDYYQSAKYPDKCFRCGSPDHFVRFCPHTPQPDQAPQVQQVQPQPQAQSYHGGRGGSSRPSSSQESGVDAADQAERDRNRANAERRRRSKSASRRSRPGGGPYVPPRGGPKDDYGDDGDGGGGFGTSFRI